MKASTADPIRRKAPCHAREKRITHLTPALALEQGKGCVVLPSYAVASLGPYAIKTLALLLDCSSDFQRNYERLKQVAGMTRYKLQIAIRELKATGYAKTVPMTGKGGTKAGQAWWVTAIPHDWSDTV